MDKKLENVCEIQSSGCGRSKIILRLNVVRHLHDYTTDTEDTYMYDDTPQGTKEFLKLI